MNKAKVKTVDLRSFGLLTAGLTSAFVLLILRNYGLQATVFGDEYVQSMHSRYYDPSQFTWPNFLYFKIYSITSAFGPNYLEAARVLNSLFWVLAGIPIYLLARRVISDKKAVLATLLCIFLPSNIYTAFFMPEALYFFAVWWLFLWLIRVSERPTTRNILFAITLLAAASLIKPHVLFLIPTFYLFYVIKFGYPKWKKIALTTSVSISAAVGLKLIFGYLLAGSSGLTIFGGTYSGIANSGSESVLRLITVLTSGSRLAPAHLLAFTVVFGLVALSAVYFLMQTKIRNPGDPALKSLSLLALAALVNLILASSIFTALVAGINELELNNRLHERYYFHVFPFFIILTFALISRDELDFGTLRSRISWAQLPLFGLALASVGFFSGFSIQWVDQPEYFTLLLFPVVACTWSLLNLANLIIWLAKPITALKVFAFILLPVYIVASSVSGATLLGFSRAKPVESSVSEALLPIGAAKERVLIAGSDIISSYRLSFELDNPNVDFVILKKSEPFDLDTIGDQEIIVIQPSTPARNSDKFDLVSVNGFTIATRR